ncbi:MAG: sugar phosphate isomerase/epimerase [Sulfolobales archaeon]
MSIAGRSFKIAVATIAWGSLKRVEEFTSIAEYVKGLGIQGLGIEYRMLPRELKERPETLKKILEDLGLENAGSYSTIKNPPLEWIKRSGTKLLWIVNRERDCKKADDMLIEFTKNISREGVTVALHNHLRTCYEDLEDLSRVLTKSQDLGICLDTAHARAAGLDIEALLRTYGDRVAMVHLKDLREDMPKSRVRFKRDFVNIGEGIINFREVIKLLKSYGFNGYIVLEIEALKGEKPEEAVAKGIERVKNIIHNL